jgi:3-mercaptopyruvate sulfurtransferase SseA
MFKFFGHKNVHILNGGLAKWKNEQREIETGVPDATVSTAVSYKADPQHDYVVSWEQVRPLLCLCHLSLQNLTKLSRLFFCQVLSKLNSETQIADARGPGRFNGTDAVRR